MDRYKANLTKIQNRFVHIVDTGQNCTSCDEVHFREKYGLFPLSKSHVTTGENENAIKNCRKSQMITFDLGET